MYLSHYCQQLVEAISQDSADFPYVLKDLVKSPLKPHATVREIDIVDPEGQATSNLLPEIFCFG